jgi:RNA recognition motif-containing protein
MPYNPPLRSASTILPDQPKILPMNSLFSSNPYIQGSPSNRSQPAGAPGRGSFASTKSMASSIELRTPNFDSVKTDGRPGLLPMPPGVFLDEYKDQVVNFSNLDKFLHLLSDHKSPVIFVKGFDPDISTVTMIYNVFSNFGNINKIVFIRSRGVAFVEYESVVYSTIAHDSLNNATFLGSQLQICYSSLETLGTRKVADDNSDEEIFYGSPLTTHRYKVNKKISINPPSETLHVSNLLIQYCTEDILRPIFANYGFVEGMKFIFMENNRNMCLVKYSGLEESFWAMANLHNQDLGGRKLQISFTRSKL